jgi:hypothetical protein
MKQKEVRVYSIENENFLEFSVVQEALHSVPHIKAYVIARNLKSWLIENCEGNCYLLECPTHFLLREANYLVMFENERDAIFFKLVWG